jgi:(p)ppGpp synthase/HD superfamily hydrolase
MLKTIQFACETHKHEKRNNGDAYIVHPMRVATRFNDPFMKKLGWLHDVIESGRTPKEMFAAGIEEELIYCTIQLTHEKEDDYMTYIGKILDDRAKWVKIADMLDNWDNKKKRPLYRKGLIILYNSLRKPQCIQ